MVAPTAFYYSTLECYHVGKFNLPLFNGADEGNFILILVAIACAIPSSNVYMGQKILED
jgi:hypothetical protein